MLAMRWIRRLLLALLLSLLVGLAIGTAIRLRLEQPTRYLGSRTGPGLPSALHPEPFDIRDIRTSILDPGHHEQQIG